MVIAPRFKAFLSVLVAMILMASCVCALAEQTGMESLSFTMEADPATMTAPGKTKVTVRLANSGQEDITTPMALYDGDNKPVTSFFDGGTLSVLKVGETKTWSGEYAVSKAQLEAGKIIFTLKASVVDASGNVAQVNLPAEAKISYIGEKVDLTINRTVTPEVARKDQVVTVQYELVNNGNVKLTNVKLREHASISSKTETVKSIEPGSSATVKFEKKAGTGSLQSHPNVTYKKDGGKEIFRATLDALDIPNAKPNLKLNLTADNTSVNIGDKVTLTLTMQNDGNVSYSGVTVKDKKLGEIFTNVDIPAGQTVIRTQEVTMLETTEFQLDLALKDNTGKEQNEKTNALKVSAYDPAKMIRLSVELSADRESIMTMPGEIYFTTVVTNNSDFEVKNIRLLHGANKVYTIGALAPGKSAKMTREYSLSQAGKYQFTAEALDSQNNTQRFESNALQIGYAPATPKPTAELVATVEPVVTYSPIPTQEGAQSNGLNALLVLTTVIGVLFVIAFLTFLASTLMRLRAARQSEAAYDHLSRSVKRDFSDASTYAEEEKPQEDTAPESEESEEKPNDLPDEPELPHTKYLKEEPQPENEQDVQTPVAEETEEGAYRLTRNEADTQDDRPPEAPRVRRATKQHKN